MGRLVPRKYGPWRAVAAAEAAEAAAKAEAAAAAAKPKVVFYGRHFAVTPERKVVEITDAVEGLGREGVGQVSAAVRAGRFTLAPNGQVAGVWDA